MIIIIKVSKNKIKNIFFLLKRITEGTLILVKPAFLFNGRKQLLQTILPARALSAKNRLPPQNAQIFSFIDIFSHKR